MKYQVKHVTQYDYSEPVTLSHNVARLRPREHELQKCLSHQLTVTPNPGAKANWLDYFGNHTDYFALQQSHRELMVVAESVVEVLAPPDGGHGESADMETIPRRIKYLAGSATIAAREFCFDSPHVAANPELAEYARPSFNAERSLFECSLDLARRIHKEFEFHPGSTTVDTPIAEVLQTQTRRLPGFCAFADRMPALVGFGRAICQRLSCDNSASGPAANARRGCVPCMGQRFYSGPRLG